jgi:hypothetical protein
MSISSVAASTPIVPPVVNPPVDSAPKAPDATPDDAVQATRATVPAPLPPGQGTRVDQIV